MLRLPNKFEGNNLTLEIKLSEIVDVSTLYPDVKSLDIKLLKQLQSVELCYMTCSNMCSEINESDVIFYTEIIFKIPVNIGAQFYHFPVISYVSNPYSLIRGYYLGFNKELDFNDNFSNNKIHFFKEGVCQIDFNFETQNSSLIELSEEFSRPLILFNSSNLINQIIGYCLLDIDKYELNTREAFEFPEIVIGNILGAEAKSSKVIFSQDTFYIKGTKMIEVK